MQSREAILTLTRRLVSFFSFQFLYGGQFTLSTLLINPHFNIDAYTSPVVGKIT